MNKLIASAETIQGRIDALTQEIRDYEENHPSTQALKYGMRMRHNGHTDAEWIANARERLATLIHLRRLS